MEDAFGNIFINNQEVIVWILCIRGRMHLSNHMQDVLKFKTVFSRLIKINVLINIQNGK